VCTTIYGVNKITAPYISRYQSAQKQRELVLNEEKKLIERVFPEVDSFSKIGEWSINNKRASYYSVRKKNSICGYVIESYGQGFSSLIKALIAVDTECRVKNVCILSQQETPGLGDGILDANFRNQFTGKDLEHLRVTTTGKPDYIQALTGATISSRGITEDAVYKGVKFLSDTIKPGKHG
jgi:electron transport complex protein RnfG